MPLYEYKCNDCGEVFEIIQRFSDAPLTHHEGCGGTVEKLISAAALQFKGSGWYITDYAKSGGSSPKNGSTKTESKSDAKPAASSDSSSSSSSGSTSDKK